jgi:nucleotide sugar dehydrogenase
MTLKRTQRKRKPDPENASISQSPSGEAFPLPKPEDYAKEFKRLKKLVGQFKKKYDEIQGLDPEIRVLDPNSEIRGLDSNSKNSGSCPRISNSGRVKENLLPPPDRGRVREGEVVVVMGVGFVGAVMAGVVADSVYKDTVGIRVLDPEMRGLDSEIRVLDSNSKNSGSCTRISGKEGTPNKFVIAMQRPSTRSYWKIPCLNRGIAPVESEDPEVASLIHRCVKEKKTLTATFTYDALTLADVVVVDVHCDYLKETLGNCRQGHADIAALEESLKIIGERIKPDCLVLIETTVPPGTTEYVAYPILKKAFEHRFSKQSSPEPLLAHSYERVMPGRQYVSSIRDFWRVCSGINEEAKQRVTKFLSEIINIERYPLTVLDRPIESETCKIVENSYRATILAFLNEWSLFAERNGVDLIKVIEAIKVRPTHSNMIFPGPGIGGYCLPKDGGLGVWAYNKLMGFEDDIFKITPLAIDINDTRFLHAAELVRDALRNMGKIVAASKVVVLGASYREDVGDTRYSGSEALVRKLTEMGAEIAVHDPYVKHWWELEKQDSYPATGHSWSRFFRNQEKLSEIRIEKDLKAALKGADAVVLAVRHEPYLKLAPDKIIKMTGRPVAVIDCFGILDDNAIRRYFELDCEVKGLGRGHVKRIKDEVRSNR